MNNNLNQIPGTIALTTSELASSILTFKGKRFSLEGYEPLIDIYNSDANMLTVKGCRQFGKSVSVAALMTAKGISRPFFNSVYVAPLSIQTSRFSKLYLQPFSESPLVKKYFKSPRDAANIFLKAFNNGSLIFLTYAQTDSDADRVRGIAADAVYIDETADVALEALDVIFECMAGSQHAFKRAFGTPKSSQNTLEVLFNRGTGSEWCVKCSHCGFWNIPNTIDNCLKMCASKTGPVCIKCSKPVSVSTGSWVAARPNITDHLSYHIPRHILTSRIDPKKWAEIQNSILNYSPTKLSNEVFGLASGQGGRILSEEEAMACCDNSKTSFDTCWPQDSRGIAHVVMGVDWSTTSSTKSYTVMTILGYDYLGKCHVLHTERINGTDILEQVAHAEYLFHKFGCQRLHGDRGVGVLQGQLLEKSLGADKTCMVQYTSAKVPLRYDQAGKYLSADRTMLIDSVILKMKLGPTKFVTPCWNLMANFWEDALAMYEEESLAGRRLYRKDEFHTDDWAHSVVFAHSAYMMLTGEFTYVETI